MLGMYLHEEEADKGGNRGIAGNEKTWQRINEVYPPETTIQKIIEDTTPTTPKPAEGEKN